MSKRKQEPLVVQEEDVPGEALTLKQENFVRAYLETGNASEAYRRAYNAENMAPQTINVRACELLAHGKIKERVGLYRKRAADEATLDRAWVLQRLMRNALIALGEETVKLKGKTKDGDVIEAEVSMRDASAANKALELLGKEQGMFVDRKEIGGPGAFDNMSEDELRDFIKARVDRIGTGGGSLGVARANGKAGRQLN